MFGSGKIVLLCLIGSLVIANATIPAAPQKYVQHLNEDNWDRMTTGEWLIVFFAPWCPACKDLEPIWNSLVEMKEELKGVQVGKVDVTDSPGLSGRFMVTALPTIYHVKDGVFRQYKRPRTKQALIGFIDANVWSEVDPIPSWKNPTSIQMSVISQFFKMSQVLREIHNRLMEDFGLPTWGSYFIFAIATIIIGALLGLIIVCVIDFIYPPKPQNVSSKLTQISQGNKKDSDGEKASDDEELIENVKDDLVDEEGSDSEEHEVKDKKIHEASASSPNARKRKPRKAD